jgi:hypothetical protein
VLESVYGVNTPRCGAAFQPFYQRVQSFLPASHNCKPTKTGCLCQCEGSYDAGISLETHMVSVFHDAKIQSVDDSAMQRNSVEYGHRVEQMIAELKAELLHSGRDRVASA